MIYEILMPALSLTFSGFTLLAVLTQQLSHPHNKEVDQPKNNESQPTP